MAEQTTQNYVNHKSVDKSLYVITVMLLVAALLSIVSVSFGPIFSLLATLLIVFAVLGIMFRMRMYSVRVQDRVIRLEMRLRLERVLPAELAGKIPTLTLPQLIGLRFASDAELPDLVRKALDEKLTKSDDIKKLVKDWQADHLRV